MTHGSTGGVSLGNIVRCQSQRNLNELCNTFECLKNSTMAYCFKNGPAV
jgi:hypothetical protein